MSKPFEIRGGVLARNALFNFFGQAVPLLVSLGSLPFIVRGLGTERFGLLSLTWVILSYFTVFDLGLGRATTKFVAEALGKGEEDSVPRLVWTSVSTQVVFGFLGTIIFIAIVPLLVENILKIPLDLMSEAKATFYLLALTVPVVLVSGSFSGVLEAGQRFDLVNAVRVPSNILTPVLTLVGLGLEFQLPGIVAMILIARFIALLAIVVLVLRFFPAVRKISVHFSFLPRLFSFGGWVMVSSTIGLIFAHLEQLLIASFLVIGVLPFYFVPHKIVSQLAIIPASMARAVFPAFSYVGANNNDKVKELFSRPFKYLFFCVVPIMVILFTFADVILQLWLGNEFAQESTTILQLLVVVSFFHSFAHIPFSAIQGFGRPDLKTKLDIIMLPIFVGLCWWLIPTLGLVGAALAKLVIVLIDLTYLSLKAKSLSKLSVREMFGEKIIIAIIIASLFTTAVFSSRMLFESLLVNVAILVGFIVIYVFLFIKIVMDDKDISVVKCLLKFKEKT